MRVSVEIDGAAIDVTVTGADGEVSIGELVAAVGLGHTAEYYSVDGRRHHHRETLATVAFCDGSLLTPWAERHRGVATVSRLAGPGAGRTVTLGSGAFDIGATTSSTPVGGPGLRPTLDEPQFRLTVHPDGETTVTPLGVAEVEVDGVRITEPTSGAVVTTGDAAYRIAPSAPNPGRSPGRHQAGRIAFARPPRLISPPSEPVVDGPEQPKPATEPQPLSWILLLAPIPFGIVMAFLFSPFFLAFTLMSPIMSLARWWDGKRRQRTDVVRIERETIERLNAFRDRLSAAAVEEAQQRRARFWCLPGLREVSAAGEAGLWEVRPDHDDFLTVHVGLGPVPWRPNIIRHGDLPGLDDVLAAAALLPSAPVAVDLGSVRGLGIVGDPIGARRLAAGVVTELAARQGPADVELNALLDDHSVAAWDWIKWLPHIYDDAGRIRLATDAATARDLLASEGPRPSASRPPIRHRPGGDEGQERTSVMVIEGSCHLDGRVPELAARVNRDGAVAVVIADRPEHLPAFCGAVVAVDRFGQATVTDMAHGTVTGGVIAAVADTATVIRTARSLARFIDPEAQKDAGLIPDHCLLTDLLPGSTDPNGVGRNWHNPPAGLVATLGVGSAGPMRVDLVRDGPHVLVAGTTGAGKSELLRTMVAGLATCYSPEAVNFVLVDFKGGGAFDACAELPHTVGVVTDLDEHLSGRALRCLKAELKHRERRLRAAGISDLRDLPDGEPPLPRLVIVVDEFATLAAELPDFMTSLVDVAQRGRSLGIHMVLATQRPSGVVDAKIKANTNLRIALRVQDDNDSLDVVGTPVAAGIHRNQPGRAFARLGASELTPFQTAIVSEVSPPAAASQIRVEPFELLSPMRPITPGKFDSTGDFDSAGEFDGPEDLQILTEVTASVAVALQLERPRVPWPPPLPDRLPLEQLEELEAADRDRPAPWSAPIGLVDLPDEQRRELAVWWGADDGNVFLYGVDTAATSSALSTMCAAVARRHRPDEAHLYIVDFAGPLSALADLPHVGAYLGPEDDERLDRLLDLLAAEIESRRAIQRETRRSTLGPDDAPLLLITIANYAALLEHFDEQGNMDGPGRVAAVVRDGPSLGIFVLASANHERGIPLKVAGLVPTKYVMRLADPMSYTSFGLRAKDVPELGPGRAIDVRTGLEMQFASCDDPTGFVAPDPANGGEAENRRQRPVRLQTLGTDIALDRLDQSSTLTGDLWRVVVGTEHKDLAVATLDLRPGMPAIIAGPPESGRTTGLYTIGRSVLSKSPGASVATIGIGIDVNPEIGIGSTTATTIEEADELEEFWLRGDLLLVDDVELLAPDLSATLERLISSTGPSPRLVAAGRTETFKTMQPLIRALTVARTGMLLRPQADAGEVFRTRVQGSSQSKGPFPPGRGHLFNGGISTIVQFAVATPVEETAKTREPIG